MSAEDEMNDEQNPETAPAVDAPAALVVDQGSTDLVVPTDPQPEADSAKPTTIEILLASTAAGTVAPGVLTADATIDEKLGWAAGRIEYLERLVLDESDAHIAELAERDARIAELEADPYRTPTRKGQLQYVSPRVAAFEENAWQAEVEGWERTTGQKYDDTPPAGIEV